MVVYMAVPLIAPPAAVAALGDARPVIDSVVWCTLATVGPDGRPRTRVVHPIWDWETGVGWVTSRPTPLRLRHLAHQSGVSLSYWSSAQDVASIDCDASWVPTEQKAEVWARCAAEAPPMGFDPAPMFPEGPTSPGFAPIELRPHRVRVALASAAARGEPAWLWSATSRG
jgi:hypothetical protein